MGKRRLLSEAEELALIEYYKTHSDRNTANTFHIHFNPRILEILQKYEITPHTKDENIKLGVANGKRTCLEHFGTESPLQAAEIKAKVAETNLKRYNNVCSAHGKDIAEKIKQTNMQKYGAENVFASEQVKQKIKRTMAKRYGVEHYSQLDCWNEQVKQTTKEHFGVEWYNQSEEAANHHRKLYNYQDEVFDSFPELCFYLYHIKNNIDIQRHPIKLLYTVNDETRYYFPDFSVDGILVEIKGDHFLTEDEKWCNPFDHSADYLYEAKHQCALANNVRILYSADYQKYIEWFYENEYKKEDFE